MKPGKKNLITDVKGLTVGNATDEEAATGITVLRCAKAFVSAVDVRGGAPGSRELHVLSPENLVVLFWKGSSKPRERPHKGHR